MVDNNMPGYWNLYCCKISLSKRKNTYFLNYMNGKNIYNNVGICAKDLCLKIISSKKNYRIVEFKKSNSISDSYH